MHHGTCRAKETDPPPPLSRSLPGVCPGIVWRLPGACSGPVPSLSGDCPEFVWSLSGDCPGIAGKLSGTCPEIARRLPRDYREIARSLAGDYSEIIRSLAGDCPAAPGRERLEEGWERSGPVGSGWERPRYSRPGHAFHARPSLAITDPIRAFSGHFLSSPAMPGHIPAFSRLSCRFWPSLTAPAMPKPSPTVSAVPVMPDSPRPVRPSPPSPAIAGRFLYLRPCPTVFDRPGHARQLRPCPDVPDLSRPSSVVPTVSDRSGHASSATSGFLSAVP